MDKVNSLLDGEMDRRTFGATLASLGMTGVAGCGGTRTPPPISGLPRRCADPQHCPEAEPWKLQGIPRGSRMDNDPPSGPRSGVPRSLKAGAGGLCPSGLPGHASLQEGVEGF